ncbi:pyrimidine 5'-nucleotidase [bacterium]|nr:pyrimidine 5'-nucleotidase [bacterium]
MSATRFILFDLDNTLYPRSCGLFDHVDRLINRYLEEVVKIPSDKVDLKRRTYLQDHGTTLNGLMLNHDVDPHDYLNFVHNVPLGDYLKPDNKLQSMLAELPEDKYIFSNASNEHCQKVLDFLGLQDNFAAVYDINYFNFRPKPEIEIYRELLDDIDRRPEDGVMIDDMAVNLQPAAKLGMATILFEPLPHISLPTDGRTLNSLMKLPQILDEIKTEV